MVIKPRDGGHQCGHKTKGGHRWGHKTKGGAYCPNIDIKFREGCGGQTQSLTLRYSAAATSLHIVQEMMRIDIKIRQNTEQLNDSCM